MLHLPHALAAAALAADPDPRALAPRQPPALTLELDWIGEWTAIASGGQRRDDSARNILALTAHLDLQPLLPAAELFAQYLSANPDRGGSAHAGDLQGFTNIETDEHLDALAELWYRQRFFDDRLRIKLGKADANADFAAVPIAEHFAHSSAGFSPTILAFPSYPESATTISASLVLAHADAAEVTIAYGLFDGAAAEGVPTGRRGPSTFLDGGPHFHVLEAAAEWEPAAGPGRFALGAWAHTARFERFDGRTDRATTGLYLTLQQRLFARGEHDVHALHAFAQYGFADESISDVAHHLAAGLVLSAPLPGREGDSAGLYASFADLSDDPAAPFAENETALDAYYRLQITPNAALQPELQYIINPSGDPALDDALVLGLRLHIAL